MRLLFWAAVALAAILFGTFAAFNYQRAEIHFWPVLPPLDVPVFLIVLAAGLIGFVAGGIVAWFGGARLRRLLRERRWALKAANRQLDEARRLPTASAASPRG